MFNLFGSDRCDHSKQSSCSRASVRTQILLAMPVEAILEPGWPAVPSLPTPQTLSSNCVRKGRLT